LIERWAPKGSNPGICIVAHEDMPNEVVDWGWAATQQILSLARAVDLAAEHDVFLHALGGTGEGIIGAMASVGLRGCVNQGRLLDWPLLLQVGAGRHEEQIGSPLATGWEMR
jgi:tRNA(Ile2) C34 agmatinyltransferase TiaS